MPIYDMNWTQNASDILGITQGVNTASGGVLGTWIIIMVAAITFIAAKNWSTKSALLISSLLTAFSAIILRMIGIASDTHVIITIIVCAAAFVASLVFKDGQ